MQRCQVPFARWLKIGSGRCSGSYHPLSTAVLQSSWEKVKVQKGVLDCLCLLQNTWIKTIVCWTVRSFRLCKLGTRRSASIVKPFMLPGTKRHAARAVRPRYRIGSCNSRGTGHNIRKQLSVFPSSGFNSLRTHSVKEWTIHCVGLEDQKPAKVWNSLLFRCSSFLLWLGIWGIGINYPAISLQLPVDLSEIIYTFHCSDKLKGQWSVKAIPKNSGPLNFRCSGAFKQAFGPFGLWVVERVVLQPLSPVGLGISTRYHPKFPVPLFQIAWTSN